MKVVAFRVKGMRIEIPKSRGLGKLRSQRTTEVKVLEMRSILEFCSLDRRFSSQSEIRDFSGLVHVS